MATCGGPRVSRGTTRSTPGGYGGQYLMVIPKADLVVLCTSDWKQPEYPQHFALLAEFIVPSIGDFRQTAFMPGDLLARAREQAERSTPAVRAAALLRIARVESAADRDQARRTFNQGLGEIRRFTGLEREFLLDQACLLAAAVAPDLLSEIPPSVHTARHFLPDRLSNIMLAHGHNDEAYEYVIRYDQPATFPHAIVSPLMGRLEDEACRIAVLRSAIEAWRAVPEREFIQAFQAEWKVLPRDEALAVAREIVRVTLDEADQPITASYGDERPARITSLREHQLFQMLPVLRHLDAPLAESLIARHEQLAVAARRFPYGMESLLEEAKARTAAAGARSGGGGGYMMFGEPEDIPYLKALIQASRDGDFGPPIDYALGQYREDAAGDNANDAPREFWPSTCCLRSIFYQAGERLGLDATLYLDRIPDADPRLFAEIELAASLAGLPELQGSQRGRRRRNFR